MLIFALLQTVVATAALAQIIIDVPDSLTQCDSTTLSWSGGNAPYIVYVCPMVSPDESSCFAQIGPIDGNSVPYTVNIPVGEKIRIVIRDGADRDSNAFTDPFFVVAGSDDSCLNTTTPTGTTPEWHEYQQWLALSRNYPGGRVTPTGPTSPATSDRIDSTASSSPTSNTTSIASASATGPVDGGAESAGFVLEISCCMFIFGTVVGIAGAFT